MPTLLVQNVKDKPFLKLLGLRIKQLRTQKGLTQLDLGVLMDNYAEQVGRIERGQLNVSICTFKKNFGGFRNSPSGFIGYTGKIN